MLQAKEEYFFSPSFSLSLSPLLSHDSSEKYFITSKTDPAPHPSYYYNYLPRNYAFFFFLLPPLSFLDGVCWLRSLPQRAREVRRRLARRERDMLAERKVRFLQLQLREADRDALAPGHTLFGFPTSTRVHSTLSSSQTQCADQQRHWK